MSKKQKINFDKTSFYSMEEAVKLVKAHSKTKFVSSIDIAVKLNLETSKSDQQLRGSISLPNFFGKKKKILVLDEGLTDKDASKLGVDFAGDKEKIEEISKGWLGFDLIITTPKMMPALSKLGKILGTRGLMPNPKIGNVTTDLPKTIAQFKAGIDEYRTDQYGNIHMKVGRVDADDAKVVENIKFLLDFLVSKKPASVKGTYIQNVSISSTMGLGVKILIDKSQQNKSNKTKSNKKVEGKKSSVTEKPIYYKPIYKVERKVKESKNPTTPPKIVQTAVKTKPVVSKKPATKPVAKTDSKTAAKPVAKVVSKPTVKPTTKPVTKTASKPVTKPVAKTASKPAAKPVAKTVNKATTKPATKPVAKTASKPAAKPVAKTTTKPVTKATSKPVAKPVAKPVVKSASKPAAKPVAKATTKPVAKPTNKTASKPAAKPVAKPATKTVSKTPAKKPATSKVAKKTK
ncbi:50S ribosomal protein L1 [Malacoplasma iowae]|uniref:Large ribosomal subunit protein uL1 n=1 Tax=Malacoplasma iowae 695 TaxID=1048830 RepID=A0A6P1LEK3_MALIO|nr:50S ribosomal protein L1 [Malacoplasma iowae]VEU62306.1 50S ribosomal protein L1 [Mycoplasmopsis fermentans]VEU72454.1 50S ribosomal protein L1 [Malacoplasma iowae]